MYCVCGCRTRLRGRLLPVAEPADRRAGRVQRHDRAPRPRCSRFRSTASDHPSNLDLSWNAGNLRLSELVPTCPAGQEDQCVRLTDPIEAQAPAQRSIHTVATNQRPENREQMKFLIENLSGEAAAYTLTIVPRSAGCT